MNSTLIPLSLAMLLAASVVPAQAQQKVALKSPEPGVLCDRYLCADGKTGVSRELTEKHLGNKAATQLFAQGDFDPTQFTFAGGIFCDVKERLCREDRYYGVDGKRSGKVSDKYTKLLFVQ